jgi:hypothetical protein
MAERRTAALLDRGGERWVVVADAGPKGKHVYHVVGREVLDIMHGFLLLEVDRRAHLDSKELTVPFDTLEATR